MKTNFAHPIRHPEFLACTPKRFQHVLVVVALIDALLVILAACAPPPQPSAQFYAEAPRSGDGVTVTSSNDLAVVEVWSESGIGEARVSLTQGAMPASVEIRLHLDGLEGFTFAYDDVIVSAEIPSTRESNPIESAQIGSAAPVEIDASSPYWLEISQSVTDAEEGSVFTVQAPADFHSSGETLFSITWVDFYR
ncbi:MAG: hypothetical protein J5I90_16840 [Caldilineales bacterium]|nr:hypothetical protein [Caldilineales bacterium]